MAKKPKMENNTIEISFEETPIVIKSMDDAIEALEEMERINDALMKAQQRTVELKKSVTEWAVRKKADVIQLDGVYYRQIQRHTRGWDTDAVKGIVKGLKDKKGRPLWNFITKRIIDPEKIDLAVKRGYISEKKINKAFTETPQSPFLQRYMGDSADG